MSDTKDKIKDRIDHAAESAKQATDAWSGIKDLQIDKNYIPPIKFHRAPDVFLEELKGQMQAVASYMQCLKDKRDGKAELTEVPASPWVGVRPVTAGERVTTSKLVNRRLLSPWAVSWMSLSLHVREIRLVGLTE